MKHEVLPAPRIAQAIRWLSGQKDREWDDLLWLADAVARRAGGGWRRDWGWGTVAVQRGADTTRQDFVHVDPVGA